MKTEKQKTITTTNLVLLGMMTGVLLLMAYTPLGYLNIGPLAISFNMIPVAITAIALGPVGGLITADGETELPLMSKDEVAFEILSRVARKINRNSEINN